MKRFLLYLLAVATIVACSKSDDVGGGNIPDAPGPQHIYLSLNITDFFVNADGGTCIAEVITNGDWTAEFVDSNTAEWCLISSTTVGESTTSYITIFVEANDTYEDRLAQIEVKAGNQSKSINIYQSCKEILSVSPTSFNVGAEGGQIQIEVSHNIDFDVSISSKWIQRVETRAFVTDTLTFDIAPNTINQVREGTITFTSSNGVFVHKVTISQYGDRSFDPSIDGWESDGDDHGGSAE